MLALLDNPKTHSGLDAGLEEARHGRKLEMGMFEAGLCPGLWAFSGQRTDLASLSAESVHLREMRHRMLAVPTE
jgi:hypothetical protein